MKIVELPEEQWRRWVMKKLKFLEGLIDDQWQKINDIDESNTIVVDEATDRAARAQRAVRRLKKVFEDHEHEEA